MDKKTRKKKLNAMRVLRAHNHKILKNKACWHCCSPVKHRINGIIAFNGSFHHECHSTWSALTTKLEY